MSPVVLRVTEPRFVQKGSKCQVLRQRSIRKSRPHRSV